MAENTGILEEVYGYIPLHKDCYIIDKISYDTTTGRATGVVNEKKNGEAKDEYLTGDTNDNPIQVRTEYNICIDGNEELSNLFSVTDNYMYVTGKQIHRIDNSTGKDTLLYQCDLDDDIRYIKVPAGRVFSIYNCIITYIAKYRLFRKGETDSTTGTEGNTLEGVANTTYMQSARSTQSCKILVNENYEIIATWPHYFSCPFRYFSGGASDDKEKIAYTQTKYNTAIDSYAKYKLCVNVINMEGKTSIINVLTENSSKDELNNKIMDLATGILNDVAGTSSVLTDGRLTLETLSNTLDPNSNPQTRWRWVPNDDANAKVLDKLLYVVQNQMDIMQHNYQVKHDALATTYMGLIPSIITAAIQYQTALISSKVQVITALSNLNEASYKNVLAKVQSKWYYIQMQAFKANNTQKLFNAQYEGASTAFSAGMTTYQPRINTDEELMTLYGEVETQFLGL